MDPNTVGQLGRELREKPRRTAAILVALGVLFIVGAWITGYIEERGRQTAEKSEFLQSDPAIRVQYYRFQGTPLLYLVTQGQGFSPSEGFKYKPYWLKNAVFQNLSDLLALNESWARRARSRDENIPFDIMKIFIEHPSFRTSKQLEFFDYPLDDKEDDEIAEFRRQFKGSMSTFRGPNLVHSFDPGFLFRKLNEDNYWTLKIEPERDASPSEVLGFRDFSFFAAPSGDEIAGYRVPHGSASALQDPVSRMLLTRYPSKRDLVFLDVSLAHDAYYGILLIREIKLLVLDIENVGDKPLGLQSLRAAFLEADDAFVLRDPSEVAEDVRLAEVEDVTIPVDMLLPGEHLFVPLRIEFGFPISIDPVAFFNSEGVTTETTLPRMQELDELYGESIKLKILSGADQEGNPDESIYEVEKSILRSKVDFLREFQRDYYLGSMVDPKEMVFRVSGDRLVQHALRKFDPNNMVVSGAFEKGSCPVVYARLNGAWRRMGPVLVDAVTRDLETTDSRRVPVATAFRLLEEEAETSYIDSIFLRVTREGSNPLLLSPLERIAPLAKGGDYLVLRRGEHVDVTFQTPRTDEAMDFELVVTGFYVPDALRKRDKR